LVLRVAKVCRVLLVLMAQLALKEKWDRLARLGLPAPLGRLVQLVLMVRMVFRLTKLL
jgi:hypothetical protein